MDDDNKEDVTHHELTVWSNQPQGRSDYQSISSCTSQQSYTSQSYVQAFAPAHFTHDGQYDSVGTTYRIGNETYQLTTPVQEVYHHQGSHSSFDRVSPVSGYHEASNAQALQQLQNLQTDGAASQMITIQGYPMQVLLEQQENRVTSSAINNASHNDVSETHNAHQLLQFAHQGHIYSCSSMTANTQQQNTLPSLMDSRGLRVQIPLNSYTNTQVDVTSGSDVLTGQRTSDDDDDDETDQAVSSISLEFHQPNNNTKVHALGDSFTTEVADSTCEHLPDLGQSSPEGSESFNCRNDNNLDGSLHHSSVNASSAMTCHILPTTSNIGHHNPINIDSTMSTVSMQPGAPDLYDNSLVLVAQSDQVSQNTMDQALDIASIENKEVRKSARLSCMEDNYLKSLTKPLYDPNLHVYTHNDIWCEECMKCYTSECPYHKLTLILDKVVLSRAWASLPSILQIFRLGDTAELGVFSKKVIPKQTQFGPFVASVVRDEDQLSKNNFILKIEDYQGTGDDVILETSDENKCNWMMFVRPAQSYAEQNLVVYQYGSDLYFTVCKQIEQKTELKVWYAAHYAYRNGATIHNLTKQEQEAIDEAENKWPCFECNKRFKTSALLQHHLLEHDDDTNDVSAALALNSSSEVKTDLNSDDNRRMNNSMFQN